MLKDNSDISQLITVPIISESLKTIEADAIYVKTLENMGNNRTMQFLVTKGGAYIGIVDLHNLLKEGII